MDPALPGGGQRAVVAGGLERVEHGAHTFPGGEIGIGGHTGSVERIAVDPEHRGRRVEGHRQHLAFGRGVVALDRADIGVRIPVHAGFGHELVDRLDRAFRGHHRRRAHFEDLQEVGLFTGAERRDPRVQGLGIIALEGRHHDIVALAVVEALGNLVDQFTEAAAVGVPPLKFGLCHRRYGKGCRAHGRRKSRFQKHRNLPGWLSGPVLCALREAHMTSSPDKAPEGPGPRRFRRAQSVTEMSLEIGA